MIQEPRNHCWRLRNLLRVGRTISRFPSHQRILAQCNARCTVPACALSQIDFVVIASAESAGSRPFRESSRTERM